MVKDKGEVPPVPLEASVHEDKNTQLTKEDFKYQSVALVFKLKKLNKTIKLKTFIFIIILIVKFKIFF